MTFGYGLQRELVQRCIEAGNWEHTFGKCQEGFVCVGPLDHERFFACLHAVLESEQTLTAPVLGWPDSEPFTPTTLDAQFDRCAPEDVVDSIVGMAGPRIMCGSDLARGATPFLLYAASDGFAAFCIGSDHAFLDGYSIRVLLKRALMLLGGATAPSAPAAPYTDGRAHMAARAVSVDENTEAAAYFATLSQPALQFGLPGHRADVSAQDRAANVMGVFELDSDAAQALDGRFEAHGVSPAVGWPVLFQTLASCWSETPIPLFHSRIGRYGVKDLTHVGPFYESAITNGPRGCKCWEQIMVDGSVQLASIPALRGSWPSDWVGTRRLEEYRLLSFNYFSPERPVLVGEAVIETAPASMMSQFIVGNDIVECRNGLYGVVSRHPDGRYEMWLRADESLTGPIASVSAALCAGIQAYGEGASLDDVLDLTRKTWKS